MQTKILSSFFKKRQNTLAIAQCGRGIQTLINTIKLYADYTKQQYQILENWDEKEKIETQCQFHIFLFPKTPKKSPTLSSRILILTGQDQILEGYFTIEDSYSLPKNIHWIEEEEISKQQIVFSHRLRKEKQKKILEQLLNLQDFYATKDLLVHL